MTATIEVPVTAGKTVAFVVTFGITQWIDREAARRGVSKSKVVRDALEKAMRDSEKERAA